MAKYVPDVKTQRWVIIAPARTRRPDDSGASSQPAGCPFCQGNEKATPPELYRLGPGEKDSPGWLVRVVPNKFPITDIHEVIIHSPNDTDDVNLLPLEHVARIITVYRDRFRVHEADGHVIIFCNHGFHAGASLTHPHAQLVVVPNQINLDALSREPIANIVEEDEAFIMYCPDFSQWPYEVWIAPKKLTGKFGEIDDGHIPLLAGQLQKALKKMEAAYSVSAIKPKDQNGTFAFNYYIAHGANWFIRIIPRFIHRAGFELGSGLNVNIVDPAQAAKQLAEVSP